MRLISVQSRRRPTLQQITLSQCRYQSRVKSALARPQNRMDSRRSSESYARVVAVCGASGHTGRFVVFELLRRGWAVIPVGRDIQKLQTLGSTTRGLEFRVASLRDPKSLDEALAGTIAVINCAGPFLDTAAPVISAALRA